MSDPRGKLKTAVKGPARYSFDLQELWFSLTRKPWRSLAAVPAGEGGDTLALCRSLAELGGAFGGAPLPVLDGTSLDLEAAAALTHSLGAQEVAGRRLVALEALTMNPLGIPVCLACDGVLLVIRGGATTVEEARRTIELIGRDHVLGSVLDERDRGAR